ncbi:NOP9 protein, partial [Sakesphorus luctuosus]|nr:NOP9 protein [Sakesphorus luctuosus]
CAGLVLQGALQALHRSQSGACARLCDALIGCLTQPDPAHGDRPLLGALQDPERSRLVEAALAVMGPQKLRRLFRDHLKGHLRGVALHRVANHGLQRLLDHAPEDVVGEVLSELGPALGEVLAQGHPAVVTALLGAARRHRDHQGPALRCLLQVGHAPWAETPPPLSETTPLCHRPRPLSQTPRPLWSEATPLNHKP